MTAPTPRTYRSIALSTGRSRKHPRADRRILAQHQHVGIAARRHDRRGHDAAKAAL
jgi:hypothetical protein